MTAIATDEWVCETLGDAFSANNQMIADMVTQIVSQTAQAVVDALAKRQDQTTRQINDGFACRDAQEDLWRQQLLHLRAEVKELTERVDQLLDGAIEALANPPARKRHVVRDERGQISDVVEA